MVIVMTNELLEMFYRATETFGEKQANTNLAIVRNLFNLVQKYPNEPLDSLLYKFNFIDKTQSFSDWKNIIFCDSELTLANVEESRRNYDA